MFMMRHREISLLIFVFAAALIAINFIHNGGFENMWSEKEASLRARGKSVEKKEDRVEKAAGQLSDEKTGADIPPPDDDEPTMSEDSCFCERENFCFATGKRFNCKWLKQLREMRLTSEFDYPQQTVDAKDVVIVTYASSNHFPESRAMLAHLRQSHTNRIIYYDLGDFSANQVAELNSVCNLEYRKFDFSKYPAIVGAINNYRFKALVAAEQLADPSIQAMWLFDTSVTLQHPPQPIYDAVNSGQLASVVHPTFAGHSIFSGTHPFLYEYLPIDVDYAKAVEMRQAVTFAAKSNLTRDVYKWMTLCSLEDGCGGNRTVHKQQCHFAKDRNLEWAKCHRFDQSEYNVITTKLIPEQERFISQHIGSIVQVKRGVTLATPLNVSCRADN